MESNDNGDQYDMDDTIETFFMNMMSKGELSAIPMKIDYRKYPVSLIRLLGYLEEQQIIACAAEKEILKTLQTMLINNMPYFKVIWKNFSICCIS